jgi:glycopeptide antibiotics resistance protein
MGLGISLEFLQGIGGVRVMETLDMLANSLGVLTGWGLALLEKERCIRWLKLLINQPKL